MSKVILVCGTYDTKDEELRYLAQVIVGQGGQVMTMDVSVLGEPMSPVDVSKQDVAKAGGSTIQAAIAAGDENHAMQIMAKGAATKARALFDASQIDGVIVLGGSMGTDLALDLCAALPVGVPKYIVSTIAFSPLLPPDRIAADVQMILWSGGLYGLNSICKAALSQAAGAVLGAARAVEMPKRKRPLIGMTSFGKTVLHYMVTLKPALEERGFEVAVFHATGMGGRAFEALASEGAFAAVFDFAPQEVSNHLFGGLSAGADRMTNAGRAGIPQLVAPGCYDLVDLVGWQETPDALKGRPLHAHNRLLKSVVLNGDERRDVAAAICAKLAGAKAPVTLILPTGGCHEWDRVGADLYDAAGLVAFCQVIRQKCPDTVDLIEIEGHINDAAFCEKALEVFDGWMRDGVVSGVGDR